MDEPAAQPAKARSTPRGKAFRVTVGGTAALLIAVLLAGGSLSAARADSAYDAARFCELPAAWNADCIQQASGTVSGVIDTSGKGAQHKLEVSTPDGGDHWVGFSESNPVVSSVLDGAPVTLTVWRGDIVSVAWDEIHETTDSAPIHHLHVVLGGTLLVLGVALLMLPAAGFARLSGSGERGTASVAVTFATVGTFFAALPVLAGAVASAVGMDPVTDFVTIAAFEVPALGFAAWLTTRSLAAGIWALETGAWWGALIVVADVLWVVRSIVTTVPMAGLRPAPATDSGWAPGTASKVRRGGKGTA